MKPRSLFIVATLPMLIGCRRTEDVAEPAAMPVQNVASTREEEALEAVVKRTRAEGEVAFASVEELEVKKRALQADLADLRSMRNDLAENLERMEAEKAKIAEEVAGLQYRWNIEIEGVGDGCIDGPLTEVFRDTFGRLEIALKENRELKEKLKTFEAVSKEPENR